MNKGINSTNTELWKLLTELASHHSYDIRYQEQVFTKHSNNRRLRLQGWINAFPIHKMTLPQIPFDELMVTSV